MHIEVLFNKSAFKHGITEPDIRSAFMTFLIDIAIDAEDDEYEKYLVIGFDTKGNLLEIMYNMVNEETVQIFHAMPCRKEYRMLRNQY